LDRSTLSEVCVPHAISLAKTFGSAITLAHVMQPHHDNVGPPTNDAVGWEISRQESQAYLERLQKDVSQALGHPVDIRLEQGRPAERLVDLAREVSADLTMLGSRGEGGAAAQALGSTVLQVLAAARGSLFIAHPSSSAAAEARPTRILVALDGSLRSESVLPAATRIASAYRAELILVHVVQEPVRTAILPVADEVALAEKLTGLLDAGAERYLQGLQHQLEHEVTSVRAFVIRHASAPKCLLEVAQKEKADLIVLSAHGSACDASRSFGSVTACLLTHTMVPLLTLQDLSESEFRDTRIADATLAPPSPRASYAAEGE
jgi:nucleotide-binding universal stress UspA family protein